MGYVTIRGIKGKFFVPDQRHDAEKKHACKDCFSCQHCADARCGLCKTENPGQSCRNGELPRVLKAIS